MNTKITTALLVSVLSLTSLSAMEMATSGGIMIKDKMTDDGTMMKKEMMKKDDMKTMKDDSMMKKDFMMKDKKMMKGMTPQSNAGNGSRGEHVTALQDFLIEKGFLVLPEGVTKGYFGMATKKALMKYQESVGVSPTGYFGPKTRMMMQEKMGMKDDSIMKKDEMKKKDENMMLKKDEMKKDMMKDTMAQ